MIQIKLCRELVLESDCTLDPYRSMKVFINGGPVSMSVSDCFLFAKRGQYWMLAAPQGRGGITIKTRLGVFAKMVSHRHNSVMMTRFVDKRMYAFDLFSDAGLGFDPQ